MTNYNTLGYNLKRQVFNFCNKISRGFHRPMQKFIIDMIYGLLSGRSCYLTEIARKLEEDIALDKVVERLSRNLMKFDGGEELWEQYIRAVNPNFGSDTVLLIDDSDISKTCSSKLEGLCKVKDGSTGEITDGYWYAGVTALTSEHKQPIPVYGRAYSSLEEAYKGNNAETLKSLEFLSSHFPASTIRAFDRGYDGGYVFDYLIPRNESFIVRMNDRYVLRGGKKILLSNLSQKFKGNFLLEFEAKNGKKANCKISIVPVALPAYPDKPLNLVICKGLGEGPLLLLTSLESGDPRLCVTVTKVYLMRWRIEEYYRFKKQEFGFEKFLVRTLKSIRNLDLFLNIAIGYIGVLSEKINESVEVHEIIRASKRLYGLSKFTFYAIAYGLCVIFSKLRTGISGFYRKPPALDQFTIQGWL